MANVKAKPIHFIYLVYSLECRTVCNKDNGAVPIDFKAQRRIYYTDNIGTFDVTKVTCKKCRNTSFYKEALDKINHPLFFWRESL